jgi:DUF4097 and DUF4098 domain-containing protein YvlB
MTVRIAAGHHRVEVVAVDGDPTEVEVEGDARVDRSDRIVTIDEVRGRVVARVPAGSELVVGTTSGRIEVRGRVGHAALVSESGRVEVESAASVDVRTETSRVAVGEVSGTCRIRSKSGRVEVERCGAADAASETGRVELRHVDGVVDAHSVSGRIELSLDQPHDVRAETVTGRIEVSLPPGTVPFRPDGPEDRRLRPPDASCTVSTRSETGRVIVATR